MPETLVSPRERLVLTAIIELYIATGEPVASQAVADHFAHKEGLSSATIRNVMASLGDARLLEQPHTSAGRVPTAAAFRYYVEQITCPNAPMGRIGVGGAAFATLPQPAIPLSEERRGQIEESFSGVSSSNEYLERTSHVLALISSGLGVALASGTAEQVLEHIHFSRLSAGRVLAVVVTRAGAVLDRVLVLDRELTHLELETAARYLNETFAPIKPVLPRWSPDSQTILFFEFPQTDRTNQARCMRFRLREALLTKLIPDDKLNEQDATRGRRMASRSRLPGMRTMRSRGTAAPRSDPGCTDGKGFRCSMVRRDCFHRDGLRMDATSPLRRRFEQA